MVTSSFVLIARVGLLAGAVVLAAGCGSDDRPASVPTTADADGSEPATTPAAGSPFATVYACYQAHGVDATDPATGPPGPARPFPTDVATTAWTACRETHLDAWRATLTASDETSLPDVADPLGFADCMATRGWLPLVGMFTEEAQLADYHAANDACSAPVAGATEEASYCRLINAVYDRGHHDPAYSITGIRYGSTHESLESAVDLFEKAAAVAPDEITDDLHSMADAAHHALDGDHGGYGDAGDHVLAYNTRVCGAWVYLGSLD